MSNLEPMPDPRDVHQYADSLESSAGHAEDLVGRDLDAVLLPDDEQRDMYGDKITSDNPTQEDAQAILDGNPEDGLIAEPYGTRAGRHQAGRLSSEAAVETTSPEVSTSSTAGIAAAGLAAAGLGVPVSGTVEPLAESVVMSDDAGNAVENAIELKEVEGLSQSRIVMRRFVRHRGAMISIFGLLAIILLAATSIGWGPIPGWYQWAFTDIPPLENVGGAPTMGFHPFGSRGPAGLWYALLALVLLALLAAAIYAIRSMLIDRAWQAERATHINDDDWVGYTVEVHAPESIRLSNIASTILKWAIIGAVAVGVAYLAAHLFFGNHPFGQDNIGRDGFARVMRGTQQSLTIMFVIGLLSTLVGVILGSLSGFFRGRIDDVIMRFTDMVITIPTIVIGSILGVWVGGAAPVTLALALSFITWTGMARLVRAQFLALREQEFVDAARVAGASNFRIMFKHILPNAVGVIIVNATLLMASAILLETALSFLGFGITAPDVSLGQIINEYQAAFTTRPWLFWWPGLFIVAIALCVNFIGDGLRDAFDPRQRRIPTAKALARAEAKKQAAAKAAGRTETVTTLEPAN